MKIKDVEKRVGISAANIRYYEKEELINPERNEADNYRDYSQQDVEQLERIKVLRILGVPISDIRKLKDGAATLNDVMEHRLTLLQEEEKNLDAVKRVCENLRQCNLSYDAISENILEKDEECWSRQLTRVLKEDITKEILTPRQFNKNLALMLSWGYFLCAAVSFFLGDWMLSYIGSLCAPVEITKNLPFAITFNSLFFIPAALCVSCYMIMYFTANVKTLLFVFHITALNLSPVIVLIYNMITLFCTKAESDYVNRSIGGIHLCLFWLMLAVYVILLFVLSKTWNVFFSKARYVVITALIYTSLITLFIARFNGPWLAALISFLCLTLFISLNWFHAYWNAKEKNNRYYAVTESCRIMNPIGTMFDMKGKTVTTYIQR